jgi:hypothetical protein
VCSRSGMPSPARRRRKRRTPPHRCALLFLFFVHHHRDASAIGSRSRTSVGYSFPARGFGRAMDGLLGFFWRVVYLLCLLSGVLFSSSTHKMLIEDWDYIDVCALNENEVKCASSLLYECLVDD